MHLKRDYLIKKQLEINQKAKRQQELVQSKTMDRLGFNALEQLSMSRVKNKQMQYHQIQLFLLTANTTQASSFYQKLKACLQQIFNNEKSKKIFEDKWSHSLKRNVVSLFNRIAKDFHEGKFKVNQIYCKLYGDTILKLLSEDKLSKIEQKFLDSFLIQTFLRQQNLKILGATSGQINTSAEFCRKRMLEKQIPKSVSNCQFLQYFIISLLKLEIPHEKYLYNQLLHAPNPKFLLPFRQKSSFTALGSQILGKLNKVDMSSFLYWNYFEYEQRQKQSYQLYNKIRKAAGWQLKIDIMLLIIKSKIKVGIQKYMNLINQKIKFSSNRKMDQNSIKDITSYVQICLEICHKKSDEEITYALEKVDISQVFQKNFEEDNRLKDIMLKLVELYLLLLSYCTKKNLKLKFIQKIVVIIIKLINNYNQEKFTSDIGNLVRRICHNLTEQERSQFLFIGIEQINRQWQKNHQIPNKDIVLINPHALNFLADFSYEFGFEDYDRTEFKVLKLELFFIMALNYKETNYFESKKKFSLTTIDINLSLANNNIFNMLERNKNYNDSFKQHLRSIFGDYQLAKPEHEGLLAVIDEIVSFRIQMIKKQSNKQQLGNFYSFLINFLEQTERTDSTGSMFKYVKIYFEKCIKAYLIEKSRLKFQDYGKKINIKLLSLDVSYLAESSISANPMISQFCQKFLYQYIFKYPQLGFDTRVLTVLSQCISLLYWKSTQQYQSKSEKIKGKFLVSNTLIPTRSKDILKRLIFLMTAMYQIVLRSHCVNENYLRIRVLYLIKENSKTANITFGWKLLKHIITSFKEDNSFVRNKILMNNSCAWFINEQFFNRRVKQMKPQKIILDKGLLPLHNQNCDINDYKKICLSVEPQLQVQFLIIPLEKTQNEIDMILKKLQQKCHLIEQLNSQDKLNNDIIQTEQNKLYDIISRIKTIQIQEDTGVYLFSRLMEICRKFNNNQLFKYVFLKIVPFLYCLTDLSQKFLFVASETLYYIMHEFNNVSRLYFQNNTESTTQDTFNLKADYFDSTIEEYQKKQNTQFFAETNKKILGNTKCIKRYMVMKLHYRRLYNLQKMYKYFVKFLSEHLHVFVAKGIPLLKLAQIFKLSFNIDLYLLEFLPLQSICYSLTSHLELVNLLKYSVQKGENLYDEAFIDDFYYKSLRMGLFHFQKRRTFYIEELLQKASVAHNIKSLRTKIDFFIQICDYLRNDDFHRFRKKKLPKRQEIMYKIKDESLLASILAYNKKKMRPYDRNDIISYNEELPALMNSRKKQQADQDIDMTVLRYGLLYLISEQIDRIKAYSFMDLDQIENPYSLSGKKRFISHEQILKLHDYFGEKSTILLFMFLKIFGKRIDNISAIQNRIKDTVTTRPDYGFPEFLEFYIDKNKSNQHALKKINYWKPPHIQVLFSYLSTQYQTIPYLQLYATKVLSRLQSEQILFYLPQIYQALTLRSGHIINKFLLDYARKSASFAHQLIWISKVESKVERDPHNKNPRLPGVDQNLDILQECSVRLTQDIIRQFTREQKSFFKQVDEFYEEVTSVSGKLDPKWAYADKKQRIQEELRKIVVPKSVYLPTNPFFQVTGLKIQSGTPMQSAAKTPFLLTFICKKYIGPDKDFEDRKLNKRKKHIFDEEEQMEPIKDEQLPYYIQRNTSSIVGSIFGKKAQNKQSSNDKNSDSYLDLSDIKLNIDSGRRSQTKIKPVGKDNAIPTSHQVEISCIFKVFDDIRQDSLALQIISLFMEIFDRHNLQLKLFPYKTISNRTGTKLDIGGIIQVVPKTVSRDSIGKTNQQSLYEFFLNNFGPEHNSAFQQARQNFIKSQAASSIISYILQIKDRHNGNILINKQQGYLVHIDFGFIFDISPANNLRFQRADFKLTQEMIDIMGGKLDSQPFKLYMGLVIKGFLIARKYHKHIINIVTLMFRSGLPCFLEKSLINLQKRFVLQMSEIQAAGYMKDVIMKAADHWTTNWYDKIQWIQQKIYH